MAGGHGIVRSVEIVTEISDDELTGLSEFDLLAAVTLDTISKRRLARSGR